MKAFLEQVKRDYITEQELEDGKPFRFVFKAISSDSVTNTQESQNKANLVGNCTSDTMDKVYRIVVKQYMTKKATPQFDFMQKFNNDIPMPLVEMVGKIVGETKGMYKMELHGQVHENATHCMHCGRLLTNPVSILYGLGPECGGHAGINPFNTEEELRRNIEEVHSKLSNLKWAGWVIKSSLKEMEEV